MNRSICRYISGVKHEQEYMQDIFQELNMNRSICRYISGIKHEQEYMQVYFRS